MADIGGIVFNTFGAGSHDWKPGMDENMLKASMLLHPSVKSRTVALPVTPAVRDCYIDPSTGQLCMWFDADWQRITPRVGMLVHVEDTNSFDHYDIDRKWITVFRLNDTHPDLPRTLAVYVPGKIRPSGLVYQYVAGMEFALAAGAPGSTATLEVAPSAPISFAMTGGTITFAAGATSGVFNVASDIVIQPTQIEGEDTAAQSLTITAPYNLYGAEGLSVTLSGKMRGMS